MIRQFRSIRFAGFAVVLATAFGMWIAQSRAVQATAAEADEPSQDLAAQVKQLREQVAQLQKQMGELSKSRIVAAGTATYTRPAFQDNKTFSRVKLSNEVASKLGDEYIVMLTNRLPTGGYPYFGAYWKRSTEGFDIYLVDVSISETMSINYDNPNTKYLIDWAVVKK